MCKIDDWIKYYLKYTQYMIYKNTYKNTYNLENKIFYLIQNEASQQYLKIIFYLKGIESIWILS